MKYTFYLQVNNQGCNRIASVSTNKNTFIALCLKG